MRIQLFKLIIYSLTTLIFFYFPLSCQAGYPSNPDSALILPEPNIACACQTEHCCPKCLLWAHVSNVLSSLLLAAARQTTGIALSMSASITPLMH